MKDQKAYWDGVAAEKICTTPFQIALFQKYVPQSAAILDMGCGYGRILQELYLQGYQNTLGVDFSENMIARGRALYPHLRFEPLSPGGLGYAENSFDAVLLVAVLTCITGDDAQRAVLGEVYRVLKPRGIVYINDFLLNEDERNTARYQAYESLYGMYGIFELPQGAVLRHHHRAWVKQSLSRFTELEYQEIRYTTMNGHTSNGYYYLGATRPI
ncbi:MAG: class I SAM-dependent methyltransferase [Spirochaetaceae bacterium]|jgi:ubiquinone/menaquinone biosynthesis C-methylase UbiE|nr:class I SAM-dependent methyltransferase [Spirochaetaceae bacterium]